MHILSLVTDNNPSWMIHSAEGRRMTVEIISWSISTKVWDRAGIELATPGSAVSFASVNRHVTDCATRPGIWSWGEDWFESLFFRNPEDRFCRCEAYICTLPQKKQVCCMRTIEVQFRLSTFCISFWNFQMLLKKVIDVINFVKYKFVNLILV